MDRYWFLHVLDRDGAPVARAAYDPDRDRSLIEPGEVQSRVTLQLRTTAGILPDYLANDAGVRLCSERLMSVIERHRGEHDDVQWLPAIVVDQMGEEYSFFVLHMRSLPDVLDGARTIKARGDFVVKPVINTGLASGYHVFSFSGATTRLVVSDVMRSAIEAECVGVDFGSVAVA